ncbi:MAG TPA: extracellular solute-binding protein [Baekduia sp.]|nr:extracellular solute-binding protein [Baekduia sp.]
MRKSRATVVVAVALMLLSLVVAACGSSDDDGGGNNKANTNANAGTSAKDLKGQTIRLWIMNNGPKPVADTERIVAPFEKRTGINVKVELVGWDVQLDRIRNAAVSGEAPDVTQAGTTQVPFFAALGGFEDLSSRVSQIGGASAYAPGIWKTSQVEGQDGTWGVPWFTEARTIYYRKDALAKAGVDPKTAFESQAALKSTLQKLKAVTEIGGKPIAPFGGPGKKAYDLVHNLMPWVWDSGGAELSDDNKSSTINSPQAVQGVKFATDLVSEGLWDKSMLERDGQQVEDQFKGGRLAVFIGGPWVLQSSTRADDDTWTAAARKNIGVASMPGGNDNKGFTFIGGSNLMMFKSSQHKDAAWELIKYLSDDQVQTDYAGLMGMFPARLKPQEAEGTVDADHEAFYAAIKDQGRSYAPIAQWAQVENAYKNQFGQILDKAAGKGALSDQEIQSQLDKAAKEADGLLAQSAG